MKRIKLGTKVRRIKDGVVGEVEAHILSNAIWVRVNKRLSIVDFEDKFEIVE